MILFGKEKRELAMAEAEFNNSGILLGEITTNRSTNRSFVCLIRGLLIFLASFGTVGSIISAFDLKFHFFMVASILLTLSMYTAFLYYNRVTFYVGYIILFVIFTISIFSCFWYVNSGYQAFTNTVYEKYSDYFHLLSLREATEYISDRQLTISVAMIFVGFFLCILLNITISGYMNLIETFLLTFPILQVALYINARPAIPYLAMLIAVYITVGILGRTGHYQIPSIKQTKKLFYKIQKKNNIYHTYLSDGPGMLTTGLYSILLSSLFLLLTMGIFFTDFSGLKQNKLKSATDEYVKTVVQTGVWSLFDRYQGTGGLSSGQLGGISSVRPDYQTDLIVTFVPYSYDTLYLKSYIGSYYSNDYFAPYNPEKPLPENTIYMFSEYPHEEDVYAKMEITNVGANPTSYYFPYDSFAIDLMAEDTYNTIYSDDRSENNTGVVNAFHTSSEILSDISQTEDYLSKYTAYYIPFENSTSYTSSSNLPSSEYEEYVYDYYLQVPEGLIPTIKETCETAGLFDVLDSFDQADTDLYGSEEALNQACRLSIASTLASYYFKEFEYTMAPGSTPYNRDFVEYFLSTQKRGYCAHYAASSALILRYLGIPTRYIEGYCIPLQNVNDGYAVSSTTEGWFSGDNKLTDSGVITAEISDGQAHAWVEIYIDGYGWIPFEFTPPSDDEEIQALDFASMFSGLFMTGQNALNPINGNTENTGLTSPQKRYNFNFDDSFGFILRPLIILLLIIFIVFICIYYYAQVIRFFRWKKSIRTQSYELAMQYDYQRFIYKCMKKTASLHANMTPREFFKTYIQLLSQQLQTSGESNSNITPNNVIYTSDEIMQMQNLLNQACFSKDPISEKEYQTFHSFLWNSYKNLKKEIFSKKI